MMKRMSRFAGAGKLLALLLCALLLAGMLPSFSALGAAKTGKLTVTLKTDVKKLPKDAEVEFTLYKIGTDAPETTAGWKFDAPFETYGNRIIAAREDSALQSAVNDLAGEIVKGDYEKTPKRLSGGSAEFTGLANGVYLGVLTKAPEGLTANASLFTIPSWNADKTSLRYELDVNIKDTYTGDLTISKSVVSPYPADHSETYSFTVTLTEDGKPLDIDKPFNTTAGTDVTFKDGVATVRVKGGDSVTILGLPHGIGYTVAEVDSKGLTPSPTSATGTIAVGRTAAFTNTRESGDDVAHGAVTVYKVDETRQNLSGATFMLYADEALTQQIASFTGGTFQIRTDDPALITYLPAVGGTTTFYLVETIAPTGYALDATPRKVVISASESSSLKDGRYIAVTTYAIQIEGQNAATVVNTPITDIARKDDKVTVTKTDGTAQISGAEFTLYDGEKAVKRFTGGRFEISTADVALKGVLPAAGETKALTLKETGVPAGYTGSDAEYAVTITASEETAWNANKRVTTTSYSIAIDNKKSATVVNTPITDVARKDDKVTVTKTDGSGEITGATFTLYDGNKEVTTFTGGKFEISTADEKLQNFLPEVGKTKTLTLKETVVPTGYTGSGTEYAVVISASKTTAWNKGKGKKRANAKLVATTVYTISIDGKQKLEVVNKPVTGVDVEYHSVTVHKVDGSNNPLRGAEFTLYDGNTAIATYGGSSVDSFSISTEDGALAKYLPMAGDSVGLTLRETKAPTGYVKTDDTYKVVLSTYLDTGWNDDHTRLITTTIYDITIGDKAPSLTVKNTPEDSPTPEGGGDVPAPPAPTPVPTTEISGTKVWVDESNIHKTRPDAIKVTLYADGSPVSAEPSWSRSGDQWTFTFGQLPKVDGSGNEITYTVEEAPVNLYESSVSGLTITNRLIPKEPERYTDLSGEKIWSDDDNARGKRPASITVRLLRDGVEVESRTVTAGTDWKFSFQNLPVDDGYGNTYTYEVREDGVSGYYARVEDTTITNRLIDGSTPPTPTSEDGTPTPGGGTTPNVPQKPEDVPERKTGTPIPHFEELADEELEELFDFFGYGTPLYGMLGTGDQIPVWVWITGCFGILALVTAIVMGRKKRKKR